jgi:quercetin dioxygenase-like cupin family protein
VTEFAILSKIHPVTLAPPHVSHIHGSSAIEKATAQRPDDIRPEEKNHGRSCSAPVDEKQWAPTGEKGLEYSVLRAHPSGGATILLRWVKGARSRNHCHPGGEEVFVVRGDVTIGGKRLRTGDFLYTPPGPFHDGLAHEETILLVNLPQLPVYE